MHLFGIALLLSFSLVAVAFDADESLIDLTVSIPDSNFLLHFAQSRRLLLPRQEYKTLLTHVKSRIRQAALHHDSGGWDAPVPETMFEVVHQDIVYEFHGSPANLKLWPTYRDALRTADAVEQNMWQIKYQEVSFTLHVKTVGNWSDAPLVATGSIYIGSFPGIG
ncbi:MAG: hypothetical protein Q9167_003166 [Letrouitia subvulpina]